MSKRVFVLVLALAAALICAALLETGCAPKGLTKSAARTERRLDALDRYSFLEFRLRRIHYKLRSIHIRIDTVGKTSGDTTGVAMQKTTIKADMTDVCAELDAAIAATEAEITRLEGELASLDEAAQADGVTAAARVAGLVDILQSIDDEVDAVKESGGGTMMELESCEESLLRLKELQAQLTALAERVLKLQAELSAG